MSRICSLPKIVFPLHPHYNKLWNWINSSIFLMVECPVESSESPQPGCQEEKFRVRAQLTKGLHFHCWGQTLFRLWVSACLDKGQASRLTGCPWERGQQAGTWNMLPQTTPLQQRSTQVSRWPPSVSEELLPLPCPIQSSFSMDSH